MKTPEEIKKRLEYCHSSKPCIDCKYDQRDFPHCVRRLLADAIDGYEKLESRLAQVERERDAAIAQLKELDCATCARMDINEFPKDCHSCRNASNWQWRGPCPENTKEEPQ